MRKFFLSVLFVLLLAVNSPCESVSSRDFDGTNDHIVLANESNFDIDDNITVCKWFNNDTHDTNFRTIFNKRVSGGGTSTFLVNYESTDLDIFQWGFRDSGGGKVDSITLSTNISIGTWYFFCGTLTQNGADTDSEMFLGSESAALASKSTKTHVGVDWSGALNNVGVAIGETVGDSSEDWDGQAAWFQVYQRVLSLGEMQEIMFNPCSITANRITCNPLWGDSPEPDLSGNTNVGTVTGAGTSTDGPPVRIGGGPD